ncbi:alpha/beta fold hydrolase [Rathayibacter sp. SD072]|uniref:alpha/beta fold hydrolase n=1 Tax=Rathayibacter sp. SD072 TaxID=2781731 RepID=UPI001A95BA99|nr:alpha/beta hydrolase [Rathayibacter sp. SD072]MBO0985785.1 alpha/beta hydrolase [Rathayibacter sp. SD072]
MTRREAFLDRQASLVTESRVLLDDRPVRLWTAGDGPVVVLLTGPGRGARADGVLLLPMLARRRRVAALELLDLEDPWRDGPRAVSAVLDLLGAEEAVVVGHSLGAAVAIEAAADPRVRALALIAGWTRPTERLVATARLWESLDTAARADLSRLVAVRSLAELGPDRTPPFGPEAGVLLAAAARADAADAAARLAIPALVVGCTADSVVGIEGAQALLGTIDDARWAQIEAGHAVLAERPAELLALLEHFLADPSRDAAGSVLPRMSV